MKRLARFAKVRTRDGNDHVQKYEVIHFETLEEAIEMMGEHELLDFVNRMYEKRAAEVNRASMLVDMQSSEL